MKTETVSIIPDVSLFAKLGSSNYTVAEAISELIDNSIDAREDMVTIDIKILKNEVIIEDDGRGMDKKKAIDSIILGKSSKQTGELGHFGMGLKTSCMSLGSKFSIHTTTKGLAEKYTIDFDAEEWEKNNKWDQQISISEDLDKNKSGTKIHIRNLKFNQHKNLVNSLLEHLSERFGVFVKNKEAKIKVNGEGVRCVESKLVDGSKSDFEITLSNGEKIVGWTGILEKGSQEKSGFNLYRYKRLIRAHEKLGYHYHPSKMWVTGEIHLDPIPVTHNKREFISTDTLFSDFFEKFKDVLKEVIDKSQNKNKEEKVKDLPKHIKETLKDNLVKALNNFDELKEFAFPGEKQLKRDENGEEHNKEKREIAGDLPEEEQQEVDSKNQPRTPKKTAQNRAKFITINGQKYKFEFDWANLDDEEKSKEAFLDPSTNTIMVLLNSKYKLLDIITPDILYVVFYLSEGIVEVFLRESNQSTEKLIHLRDGIIKRLADIYADDLEIKIKEKDGNEIEGFNHLVSSKNQEDTLLNENEKTCLIMRLEKGMLLKEIGDHFGFTRERARQVINEALFKINNPTIELEKAERKQVKIELDRLKKEEGKNIKSALHNQKFQEALEKQVENEKNMEEQINSIIENSSKAYDVSIEEIKGESRKQDIVVARHIAIYNLKNKLNLSFSKIGTIFNRDHTTIMHACKNIDHLLKKED